MTVDIQRSDLHYFVSILYIQSLFNSLSQSSVIPNVKRVLSALLAYQKLTINTRVMGCRYGSQKYRDKGVSMQQSRG